MTDGLPKNLPADSVVVPSSDAPFRKVIDSTVMISVARFVMPLLTAAALTGLGWVINDLKAGQRDGLAELKDGQRQVWSQMSKMADTQAATNSVQAGLVGTVTGVVKQIDRLQAQVDSLPRR